MYQTRVSRRPFNTGEWSYDPTTDELIMIQHGESETNRDRFVVVLDWPAESKE